MFKKIAVITTIALAFVAFFPFTAFAAERYEILRIGDEDEWVYDFQKQLNASGYLQTPATGYFGTDTQNAVIQYQTDKGLTVDGKAGPQTRQSVYGSNYKEIDGSRTVNNRFGDQDPAASASPSTEQPVASSTADSSNPGDKGDHIAQMQQRLKDLEYYDYASITGYYGPITTEAVKKFQRTHNLTVDGIMSTECSTLLYSEQAKYYTMYPQDSGDDIKSMQDRLSELGFFEGNSTGYFGNVTLNAVKRFQDANGLSVDGIVGKNTRNILYSGAAVSSPSGNADSGSSDQASSSSSSSASSGISRALEIANSQMGKPYSYGSSGPNSFDCSGFVYYCLKNAGIAASRLSSAGYSNVSSWDDVSDMNSLEVGDLVYFKSDKSSTVSHIGIYIGGGSMIHSAPSSGGVSISSMTSGYYARNFLGAKRI